MQIPKQLSESGRKCLGFAETVNCALVILLECREMKRKFVVKNNQREKSRSSWGSWVRGDKVPSNFWKVYILKIYVHHHKHSQHLCKTYQTLPGKGPDTVKKKRKMGTVATECKPGACPSGTQNESNTDVTTLKSYNFLPAQQGQCKSPASGMSQGVVLAWLAMRSRIPDGWYQPSVWIIPMAPEGNPR